jgi:hypothetical protein
MNWDGRSGRPASSGISGPPAALALGKQGLTMFHRDWTFHKGCLIPLIGALLVSVAPAAAQKTPPQNLQAPDETAPPEPTALTVGAVELAGNAALSFPTMSIDVSANKIVYSYQLRNSGALALDLAGAVELPTLEPTDQSGADIALPRTSAENPVDLALALGDAPIATSTHVRIAALGLNRLNEVKTAQLPYLPFGSETEKAIAQLAPDVADKLSSQGILSPGDPKDPRSPRSAAWTLDVTRSFNVSLPPGKTTELKVTFTPIKSVFRMTRADLDGLDDLKDDMCVASKTLAALRGRLSAGGQWDVTEFSLDADAPNDWAEAPKVTISVQKPRPDSIVAFCGANDKGGSANVVTGAPPEDSEDNEISIMIFTPA